MSKEVEELKTSLLIQVMKQNVNHISTIKHKEYIEDNKSDEKFTSPDTQGQPLNVAAFNCFLCVAACSLAAPLLLAFRAMTHSLTGCPQLSLAHTAVPASQATLLLICK